jgi:predicted RNA-binding Zn-ribbon protein involved in translation (DUF1610 family)
MQKSQTVIPKQKWATFAYIGKETMYITKIFKCKNNIAQMITAHDNLTPQTLYQNKFSATGVYKLKCPDCGKAYIVQTGRYFSKRYNEHTRAFRNNCHSPKFAQCLTECMHAVGPVDNIMQISYYEEKDSHLNAIDARNRNG